MTGAGTKNSHIRRFAVYSTVWLLAVAFLFSGELLAEPRHEGHVRTLADCRGPSSVFFDVVHDDDNTMEDRQRVNRLQRGAMQSDAREATRRQERNETYRVCADQSASWNADRRGLFSIIPQETTISPLLPIEQHHPSRAPPARQ